MHIKVNKTLINSGKCKAFYDDPRRVNFCNRPAKYRLTLSPSSHDLSILMSVPRFTINLKSNSTSQTNEIYKTGNYLESGRRLLGLFERHINLCKECGDATIYYSKNPDKFSYD